MINQVTGWTASSQLMRWMEIVINEKGGNEIINAAMTGIAHYIKEYTNARNIDRLEATKAIYALMDEIYDQSTNPTKKVLSCRKGCSFCCHILVEISEDEADLIVRFCREHNIEIDATYLQAQAQIPDKGIARSPVSKCHFLKDNICSIYPVRPIACRKYFVASDPKLCDSSKKAEQVAVYFDLDTEVLVSAASNVVKSNTPMPIAILKALNHV